jgi:tetratricopeptide (TPR) repeat protein
MTDHRVPRRPGDGPSGARSGSAPRLVAFDDAAERMPARELERARGLALASLPATARSTRGAQEAIRAIVPQGIDIGDTPGVVAALAGDAEALRGLGDLLAQTGRIDGAVTCWEAALVADPHDAATMTTLALQMQRAGRIREAVAMLDRVVATNPWVSSIHFQRGTLLASLGRFEEAIEAVRKSLELDPSRVQVRSLLADLLDKAGRGDEAAAERKILSRLKAAAASAVQREHGERRGPESD